MAAEEVHAQPLEDETLDERLDPDQVIGGADEGDAASAPQEAQP